MLKVQISVEDIVSERTVGIVQILRRDPHPRIPEAFYYQYGAMIEQQDTGKGISFTGKVLHSYKNGAIALVNKVTRSMLAQQKAMRQKEKEGS